MTASALLDVLEGWETREKALDIYGVAFSGEINDETLAIDAAATEVRRSEIRGARGS